MKHVKRGQPVILCTKLTTTPSTIPLGKHVISVLYSSWLINHRGVSKNSLYLFKGLLQTIDQLLRRGLHSLFGHC